VAQYLLRTVTRGNRRRQTSPPCAANRRTVQNVRLWFWPQRHPQNWNYITYCTAVRGPSHGHREHVQENMLKFAGVVFDMRSGRQTTNRQTDKHTDTQTTMICIPTGAAVTMSRYWRKLKALTTTMRNHPLTLAFLHPSLNWSPDGPDVGLSAPVVQRHASNRIITWRLKEHSLLLARLHILYGTLWRLSSSAVVC